MNWYHVLGRGGMLVLCGLVAACRAVAADPQLPVELPGLTPPAEGAPLSLVAEPSQPYGIYAPGQAIAWAVSASSTIPAVPGWSLWAKSRVGAWATAKPSPVPHIAVHMGNGDTWALVVGGKVPVAAGQVWTFSAVVSGRAVGGTDGYGALGIVAYSAQGEVADWQLGRAADRGSFPWQPRSATVTVPEGVAALSARFEGVGGGDYFVAGVALTPGADPAPLSVPDDSTATDQDPPPEAPYRVVDADGQVIRQGLAPVGQELRFSPPAPGFYELLLADAAPGLDAGSRSSAVVVPESDGVLPGSNPFGAQASPPELLPRLGLTWSRPLHYNIVTGAHNALPTDLAGYADAWETKVREGLPADHLRTVEIWNEPESELGQLGRDWQMVDFVAMTRAAREGARRADPGTRIAVNFINVLWGGDSTYRDFVRAGGGPVHDVLSLHPYSMHLYNEPRTPEGPEEDLLLEYLASVRELMRQQSVADREIWSTEYGWPTHPGHPWSTTELNQARFIVRSSILQLAGGVSRVNPFRMTNVPDWGPMDGTFGMMRDDGSPKPSMAAYSVLAQTVHDLPYAGRLSLGHNVGAFVFGNEKRTVLALWRPDAETVVSLSLPMSGARLVGLFGETTALSHAGCQLAIGPSPVYLECPVSPERLAAAIGQPVVVGQPVGVFDVGKLSRLDWSIPWLAAPPVVDGRLEDWAGPEIALEEAKRRWRARARVAVNRDALYVSASVRGPGVRAVNVHDSPDAWDGDGVDVYLSAQPEGRLYRAMRVGVDHRFILTPGNQGVGAAAHDHSAGAPPRVIEGARVDVRLVADGYDLEASVPLSAVAPDGQLRPGAELALDVAVDIGDGEHQQGRLATHRGMSWFTSYVWGKARVEAQ